MQNNEKYYTLAVLADLVTNAITPNLHLSDARVANIACNQLVKAIKRRRKEKQRAR